MSSLICSPYRDVYPASYKEMYVVRDTLPKRMSTHLILISHFFGENVVRFNDGVVSAYGTSGDEVVP